jgi:phosphoribosylaminoimidazolecarboxamide formyltransferase/IMP cyclohydrolase
MKRALISVSDKAGVADFARGLSELGFQILSTGGTAKALREAGLEVTDVSQVTGFPEMMDGRVKTLHPAVHGALLARRDTPEHMQALESQNFAPIDVVCVNLYPFEATVARPDVTEQDAIENIDIGGPSMLRSASKNFESVTVVVDPSDYNRVLEELRGSDTQHATRKQLAVKAFAHTAAYDAAITKYLSGETFPQSLRLPLEKAYDLRYGENPHQRAAFFVEPNAPQGTLAQAKQVHGIALSFVNLFDLDGAWNLVNEFDEPAACIVKHANPCGCAIGETLAEAFVKARDADPVSRFGGIIACNRVLDVGNCAGNHHQRLDVSRDYRTWLRAGSAGTIENRSGWGADLRLLETGVPLPRYGDRQSGDSLDYKRVSGGLLVQDVDRHELSAGDLKTVTQRAQMKRKCAICCSP